MRLLKRTLAGFAGPLEGVQAETMLAIEALQTELQDETNRLKSISQTLASATLAEDLVAAARSQYHHNTITEESSEEDDDDDSK